AHRVSGAIGAGITELWLGGKYGCARDFLRH
ncbi:transcriptional regulator GadX, partial [Escherichia coli]